MTSTSGGSRGLRLAFWATVLATVVTYIAIVAWSAPTISEQANGRSIFDLRPTGYTFEEAKAFLDALSDQGRQFYLSVQHRLDFAYPALLAITTIWAYHLLLVPRRLALLASLLPLSVWILEMKENAAVATMLHADAQTLTAELVGRASFYTALKSGLTTASMSLLLLLIIVRTHRMLKRRRDG